LSPREREIRGRCTVERAQAKNSFRTEAFRPAARSRDEAFELTPRRLSLSCETL
jgi:hypothetical protein